MVNDQIRGASHLPVESGTFRLDYMLIETHQKFKVMQSKLKLYSVFFN
jgi:hypothetical protein